MLGFFDGLALRNILGLIDGNWLGALLGTNDGSNDGSTEGF